MGGREDEMNRAGDGVIMRVKEECSRGKDEPGGLMDY